MLLSNEDRVKFAQWCEQEAHSNKIIIEQMEKMKLPDAMIKPKRIEVMAVSVVHKMLTSGEQQTIGGSGEPTEKDG